MAHAPQQDGQAPPPTLADLAQVAPATRPHRMSGEGRRRRPPRPFSRLRRWLVTLLVVGVLVGGGALGAVGWFLDDQGRSPREWAPYVERRASGNHPVIVEAVLLVARALRRMDVLRRNEDAAIPPGIGASPARSGAPSAANAKLVLNAAQLAAAIAQAMPGQVITLVPGNYPIEGRGLRLERPGAANAPVVLRAERLGDATILSNVVEAIKVSAPHWVIENLVVRGVCDGHSSCEHAVHVTGAALGTVIRNNRFEDFNAQIKINGEDGVFPDNGRIEGNTLVNGEQRSTRNPITPIDLVSASNWRITGNFIADFQRTGLGAATYGAFMKGAGEGTVMERNVVLCEWKLRRSYSPNIGLSVGGGGTFPDAIKRDLGKSGAEQHGGIIRDNLIAFCNDIGIYVNKGRRTVVANNTVLDTAGIGVRFAESSAEVVGNLIDGVVQTREGAVVRARDNAAALLLGLFVGHHPAREMFRDVARLDLRWRDRPDAITTGELRPDLCGVERTGRVLPGAFEDFGKCKQ